MMDAHQLATDLPHQIPAAVPQALLCLMILLLSCCGQWRGSGDVGGWRVVLFHHSQPAHGVVLIRGSDRGCHLGDIVMGLPEADEVGDRLTDHLSD